MKTIKHIRPLQEASLAQSVPLKEPHEPLTQQMVSEVTAAQKVTAFFEAKLAQSFHLNLGD